ELLVHLERRVPAPQRDLELGDRLVDQSHLLERDAQIVMAGPVIHRDVLPQVRLELLEDLREVPLLVPGRLLIRHHEPRDRPALPPATPRSAVRAPSASGHTSRTCRYPDSAFAASPARSRQAPRSMYAAS